jgi:hypothetical protein
MKNEYVAKSVLVISDRCVIDVSDDRYAYWTGSPDLEKILLLFDAMVL